MKFKRAGLAFFAMLFCISLFGCLAQPRQIGGSEEEQVRARFDGYEWSWHCWNEEVQFTLWKEHITRIEKIGDYWAVEGISSGRWDLSKSESSDKSGRVLFVYDKLNDKIVNWVHGEYGPDVVVKSDGNITGLIPLYC